jgi:predicted TIM-barrel enzyme
MMFSRSQILDRLKKQIAQENTILAVNCSAGISAKYSEQEEADLITVHSTGKYRYRGVPYPTMGLYWGAANSMIGNVFEIYHEIDNATNDIPLICGLEAYDPLFRKTDKLIDKALCLGYDGIQNWPTWGYNIPVRRLRDGAGTGFGFEREVQMIEMAHEMDIFTMAYAFWPDDAKRLAEAGADVIIAHAGWTVGGDTGAPDPAKAHKPPGGWEKEGFAAQPRNLEDTCKQGQTILQAARSVNKDVMVLLTGGSLSDATNAQKIADRIDIDGFELEHALEGVAFGEYLVKVGQQYKNLPCRAHPKKG